MRKNTMGRSKLNILDILSERYSPRAFSERDVTDAELELLLEAARWAPSSMNEQPWRFLVVRRMGVGHAALLECLNPSNRRWADKAPVLIAVLAKRTLTRNGQENFHARHDVGLAVGHLLAQATSMGMGLHILGGFNATALRAAFAVPEELDVVSVLVLGFPGVPESLEPDLRERENTRSTRKPLSELVSYGRLGE